MGNESATPAAFSDALVSSLDTANAKPAELLKQVTDLSGMCRNYKTFVSAELDQCVDEENDTPIKECAAINESTLYSQYGCGIGYFFGLSCLPDGNGVCVNSWEVSEEPEDVCSGAQTVGDCDQNACDWIETYGCAESDGTVCSEATSSDDCSGPCSWSENDSTCTGACTGFEDSTTCDAATSDSCQWKKVADECVAKPATRRLEEESGSGGKCGSIVPDSPDDSPIFNGGVRCKYVYGCVEDPESNQDNLKCKDGALSTIAVSLIGLVSLLSF